MVEPSGDLQAVFDRAVGSAKSWRHEYVTLEHLLFSMLEDKKFNGIVKDFGADPEDMKSHLKTCLLYTSPSPRDRTRSRMPSSA